ncbi:MAG: HD domain-containing protein [Acidaminococcaceae bacterium]|nr:HD domain-containing protein [Acidaminococcaceae bacterium]HAY61122.1 phosphohydrolase [Acidaminococcaceae bacterium]
MYQNLVLQKMIAFDKGDARRIQHFLKVCAFASLIGAMERLPAREQEILETAAILHDIGIHPAMEKYGRQNGKLQEQEGPAPARRLLEETGKFPPEYIDRVCFLIAHHHTYDHVEGRDWQILLEADFLVNAYEDGLTEQAIRTFRDKVFRTPSGIALLNTQFALAG